MQNFVLKVCAIVNKNENELFFSFFSSCSKITVGQIIKMKNDHQNVIYNWLNTFFASLL